MPLVHLHKRGQMTLPHSIRERIGLSEGDLLDVEVEGDVITLRPQKAIDAGQAFFWTQEWQAAERKASEDIAQGRTRRFEDPAAAITYLREEAAKSAEG